jgi:hypothetical protein
VYALLLLWGNLKRIDKTELTLITDLSYCRLPDNRLYGTGDMGPGDLGLQLTKIWIVPATAITVQRNYLFK